VVVVVVEHPVDGQASQQLVELPTQAVLPFDAVQCAASRLILHFVPLVLVTQQVTEPGFPQVDFAAHFLTAWAQLLLTRVAFACCAAQLT
jgi:hypothetical protein